MEVKTIPLIRISDRAKLDVDEIQKMMQEDEGRFVPIGRAAGEAFSEHRNNLRKKSHIELVVLPDSNSIRKLESAINENIKILSNKEKKPIKELREDFDRILNSTFIQKDKQFKTNLDKYYRALSDWVVRNVRRHKVRWIVEASHLDKEKSD